MSSQMNLIPVYLTSGLLAVLVLSILSVLIHRWKNRKSSTYPSIVLTCHDSPQLKETRLWSPSDSSTQAGKGSKSTSKAERSEKVRSYWFPKRDIIPFMPPTRGEYQQPSISKHTDEPIKGRLKFSIGYDYNLELKKSILTVHLHHGRDYTDGSDDLPMDTFVKTRLLPSKKQAFTSKLQRRTLNPNYNEFYQFDIEYSELNSQVLCFEIFRYDSLSSYETFGEVIVPFRDLGSSGCNVIKEISMSMNIVDYTGQESDQERLFEYGPLLLNNNVVVQKRDQMGSGLKVVDDNDKDR